MVSYMVSSNMKVVEQMLVIILEKEKSKRKVTVHNMYS